MKKGDRLVALTRLLVCNPGKVVPLNQFIDSLGVAKSTLSEDLAVIRRVFAEKELGWVETITGAAGGVRYIPVLGKIERKQFIEELCRELANPQRILPGNYLYMSDLFYSPDIAWNAGRIFAGQFRKDKPEYVLTMETKGIPLATMTARALNCKLLIIRRAHRVTEGPAVSINYITGSSRNIESMSLPRRALPPESKVILIDDFMKAGGTARGMLDLMNEFQACVLGLGVMVATEKPEKKLVDDYYSLVTLMRIDDEHKEVVIVPSDHITPPAPTGL